MGNNGTGNFSLKRAQYLRNDEFYTRLKDVRRELQYYDFTDKVVYCPCDREESAFVQYFKAGKAKEVLWCEKDFRKSYSQNLMQEADVVVTNPPFSLIREFLAVLKKFGKKFLILAPLSIINNSEVFKGLQKGELKIGYTEARYFITPEGKIADIHNTIWLTNLYVAKKPLRLHAEYREKAYIKYDGTNIIDVPEVRLIPKDYDRVIGVPITFFKYYCPEQFKVLSKELGLRIKGVHIFARVFIRRKQDEN